MNSIKAIIGGLFSIIFMGLLAQLIFLFVGIGYFKLVKDFPSLSFLSETTTVLLFIITAVIAFLGGVLTAKLANKSVIIHCLLVGSLAGALTLFPALRGGQVTINGLLLLIIILLATVSGGLYWKKKRKIKSEANSAMENAAENNYIKIKEFTIPLRFLQTDISMEKQKHH